MSLNSSLVDDEPPTVQCSDFTESAPIGSGGIQVNFPVPIATDNSGTVNLVSSTSSPGDFFVTGTTLVAYFYSDPSGNTAQCSFNVVVVEGKINKLPSSPIVKAYLTISV